MDEKQKILLKQLEQFSGSKFNKVYEGALEGFAYYFSKMDIDGLDRILNECYKYDGLAKEDYLKLIERTFNDQKSKQINALEAIPGVCSGCLKGCKGFTFINSETGTYIDMIIEVKNNEVTDFMECYDLINNKQETPKKERLIIKKTMFRN